MCGIAGLLGVEPGSFADRVRPAIAHRGPDDAGTWQNTTTCLVQTRLAILDLSPSGHQPMASPCGRWQLVFNGEIYNHASLRQRLEAEGERFRGSGDTEVLLRWMARRGRSGLADLRGMYAFCLVDTRDGSTSRLDLKGVFMAIGHTPNTQLFKEQITVDPKGYILTKTDKSQMSATNVPGVFACGDVQDSRYRQAITAAGSGCAAALDAEHFLNGH
jgi:hypothetical protein